MTSLPLSRDSLDLLPEPECKKGADVYSSAASKSSSELVEDVHSTAGSDDLHAVGSKSSEQSDEWQSVAHTEDSAAEQRPETPLTVRAILDSAPWRRRHLGEPVESKVQKENIENRCHPKDGAILGDASEMVAETGTKSLKCAQVPQDDAQEAPVADLECVPMERWDAEAGRWVADTIVIREPPPLRKFAVAWWETDPETRGFTDKIVTPEPCRPTVSLRRSELAWWDSDGERPPLENWWDADAEGHDAEPAKRDELNWWAADAQGHYAEPAKREETPIHDASWNSGINKEADEPRELPEVRPKATSHIRESKFRLRSRVSLRPEAKCFDPKRLWVDGEEAVGGTSSFNSNAPVFVPAQDRASLSSEDVGGQPLRHPMGVISNSLNSNAAEFVPANLGECSQVQALSVESGGDAITTSSFRASAPEFVPQAKTESTGSIECDSQRTRLSSHALAYVPRVAEE